MLQLNAFRLFALATVLAFANGCSSKKATTMTEQNPTGSKAPFQKTGSVERLDPVLDNIIMPGAQPEIIAEGFVWSEGPLWLPKQQRLIFSDIPPNKIYQWTEANGLELYLTPSGYTGSQPRGGEVGSNGLTLDKEGNLVLCQHGNRCMARMEATLDKPAPKYKTLASHYQNKRFNSPNDAVYKSNGDLYFTDPPYGLEKNAEDPAKELDFQGVYRLSADGTVTLLTKELSRPNGLAFSPDEKTLYIANSDPEKAIWMAYDVQPDGTLANGRLFYDATALVNKEKGLPDGLKVNQQGYIFATGPGGVFVFDKTAKLLGMVRTGQATSNCAFNDDESILYITADGYVMRLKVK